MANDSTMVHCEYEAMKFDWDKCRDCYIGSRKVKERKERYLPMPNGEDVSDRNIRKYNNYILRAIFLNVVAPTIDTMVGSIFRRDPRINIPAQIEYILDDASGSQIPFLDFIKKTLTEVAITGRYGILIDQLPSQATNKAEEEAEGIMPRMTAYRAEAIINWHEEIIDGIKKPDLIVLNELREIQNDKNEFDYDRDIVQRKLYIEDGVYKQTLWDKDKQIPFENGEMVVIPTKKGGKPFNYIPFVFLGVTSNTPDVDQPPILPLAELNLGHYRNSADLEEGCFIAGQPTLILTGVTQDWVTKNFENGLLLGAGNAIPLPKDGNGFLIQAAPNNLVASEMSHKEEQMLKVGARATDGTRGRETATAAGMRIGTDEAMMLKLSHSVSSGIEQALAYLYDYVTGTLIANKNDIVFQLNKIFFARIIDPQLVLALIETFTQKLITFEELRANLLEMGIVIDEESDIKKLEGLYEAYVTKKDENLSAKVTAKQAVNEETVNM